MARYDEILCDGQLKTQAMVRAVVRGAYLTVSLQISCGRSEIMSFGAISLQCPVGVVWAARYDRAVSALVRLSRVEKDHVHRGIE